MATATTKRKKAPAKQKAAAPESVRKGLRARARPQAPDRTE